ARNGNEIAGKRQADCLRPSLECARDLLRLKAHEGNRLQKCSVEIPRFQPHLLKLLGEIGDRLVFSFSSGPAPLKLVRREYLDVRQDLVRLDSIERGFQARRRCRTGEYKHECNPGDTSEMRWHDLL